MTLDLLGPQNWLLDVSSLPGILHHCKPWLVWSGKSRQLLELNLWYVPEFPFPDLVPRQLLSCHSQCICVGFVHCSRCYDMYTRCKVRKRTNSLKMISTAMARPTGCWNVISMWLYWDNYTLVVFFLDTSRINVCILCTCTSWKWKNKLNWGHQDSCLLNLTTFHGNKCWGKKGVKFKGLR